MYDTLRSPIDYGGLKLKNRILFAPTTLGLPADQWVAKLERIAAGGCAMIIVGDVPVGKSGFGPSLYTGKGRALYAKLARRVHAHGCLLCAQLHQSDSNAAALFTALPALLAHKIDADGLRKRLNEAVGPYITNMPVRRIEGIIQEFGEAAVRAREVGFDMVQVHGDRMCGSFSSALFNRRADGYGGSAENRARFAVEAVAAVRARVPDMPIDYKLAVRQEDPHYGNAGVPVSELPVFVPLLEQAGATSFHVTLADHGSLSDTIPPASHPDFGAEGCFLPFCDKVRPLTRRPLCGVGGLTDPDQIEAWLAAGRMDCAAMSRQLIADPDWPDKVFSGRTDTLHRCVRCNRECLGGMMHHRGVHCIYEREEGPL